MMKIFNPLVSEAIANELTRNVLPRIHKDNYGHVTHFPVYFHLGVQQQLLKCCLCMYNILNRVRHTNAYQNNN